MRHLTRHFPLDGTVIPLGTPDSLDAGIVGDGAALLSRALSLGLPVANGFVVTVGFEGTGTLRAVRQAWTHARGPVRMALSVNSASGHGFGAGPHFHNGSTWSGLLDGLCDLLAHDQLENPHTHWRPWSIVIQRVPAVHRSVLVMGGDPFGSGRGISIWTRAAEGDDLGERLTWRRRRRLRALAREAAGLLGHPVDLEVVYDRQGIARIVDCRPYGTAPWNQR
ncbi:hypothetical protein Pth03_18120 [Planotetraspora thailandica]|uniref:Uncharacterized protein n=1 Tax=Planotetraspora thailandica TaxID=487172 RepID=A0A8J3UY74_9ACTN|nr:hypothetical protein [Planotetraspora thailandica]GII53423.1 hypothetical protein Pth03_18120 [Planotetraspora thailandica]